MKSTARVFDAEDETLHLEHALLLYRSRAEHVYVTAHDVLTCISAKGAKVIGPGRAATKESLAVFADAISAATSYRGMVPHNLLYIAPNTVAWWTPTSKRRVWFQKSEDCPVEGTAEIVHPGLIFITTPGDWAVFAFIDNGQRPDANTMLYKAPYFNIDDRGSICAGNTTLPPHAGPDSIGAFESAFFQSRFTHPNDEDLVRYEGHSIALWTAQLAHPDINLLVPEHFVSREETLEQAIKRISKDY